MTGAPGRKAGGRRTPDRRIAVISNGHGEDLMASLLADRLRRRAAGAQGAPLSVVAFPIVGEGRAYARLGIPVAGVQRTMPSGGFILRGAANLFADLKAGLPGLVRAQVRELAKRRGEFDAVIALGDVVCLWLAGRVLRQRAIFVPTAKSEYIRGHYALEYRLMRRHAVKVFPRDQATADAMIRRGLPAEFVGNLMMDALEFRGIEFFPGGEDAGRPPVGPDRHGNAGGDAVPGRPVEFAKDAGARFGVHPVVALLPGSREEAYENAADLSRVVMALPERFRFLLSLAPGLDPGRLRQRFERAGEWRSLPRREADPAGIVMALERGGHRMLVVQGHFGDILSAAAVVVGLAGTGNEQAAGLGKPVVAFPGRGAQYTRRFAADQKRLLGEALSLVEPDPVRVALEVRAILDDPARYARMAEEGRRRMGPPGGLDRMADKIEALIA